MTYIDRFMQCSANMLWTRLDVEPFNRFLKFLFIFVILSSFGYVICLVSGIATKVAMASSKSFTIFWYRSDGVVVRASASLSVDLGFISLVESYQKTLKNGIHSFLAWRSAHKR